ncbi:hypothetical protein DIPPA_31164 [Diplonema papillatum]|nr:hypothetical protein DIPPA_31164 [Diplonema papillatum]
MTVVPEGDTTLKLCRGSLQRPATRPLMAICSPAVGDETLKLCRGSLQRPATRPLMAICSPAVGDETITPAVVSGDPFKARRLRLRLRRVPLGLYEALPVDALEV